MRKPQGSPLCSEVWSQPIHLQTVRDPQRATGHSGVLRAHGVTDKGRVRQINEDCFLVDESLRLCVIADGMGGHNAGEVAARLAVDAVGEHIREALATPGDAEDTGAWPFGFHTRFSRAGNILRTAIHIANVQVLETALATQECSGMGTTIVAALLVGDTLSVAHVGDSRLYVFSEDRLRQLTLDDSWMASVLAEDPQVDPASLVHHPMRNALTNAVGALAGSEVHVLEERLTGGEFIAMTTDGIHGVLEDARIAMLLSEGWDPAAMATNLVRTALARGSMDNCTAIVAHYCEIAQAG
jgi:PPM family protein phosphatase